VASFLVRIFRDQSGYLGVIDGWGSVQGSTLSEVREEARNLVREIVAGAFPPRTRIEIGDGVEVLRLRLEVSFEPGGASADPAASTRAVYPEAADERPKSPRSVRRRA